MAEVMLTLTPEEFKRAEELGKREGLTLQQIVRLGLQDLLSQPDEAFRAAARRIFEKNAELYRRLACPAT